MLMRFNRPVTLKIVKGINAFFFPPFFCRGRLPTSASMRIEVLLPGVDHVPAPDPEVAIHLPIITEDLPLHATSHLHAMLCHGIVHHPGGTPHRTIAHPHVIIGRKTLQS